MEKFQTGLVLQFSAQISTRKLKGRQKYIQES